MIDDENDANEAEVPIDHNVEAGEPNLLIPILDVPTRWSSTYLMIKRALKLRKALDLLLYLEKDLNRPSLDEVEWISLQLMSDFLEPFGDITQHIEGFKYPTISCVVSLYNTLLYHSEEWAYSKDPTKRKEMIAGAKAAFKKN